MENDRNIAIENIEAGTVIYAKPGDLIVEDVLTSQSLRDQKEDKHPLLVLSVDQDAQKITVTYIASFNNAGTLSKVGLKGEDPARRLFVPIKPAQKEYGYEPIEWANNPEKVPCWVSVRNKTTRTGSQVR